MHFQFNPLSNQHQQAHALLNTLLQRQDYFNHDVLDQIQLLTQGHTHYFDVKIWQNLLEQQADLAHYLLDFLLYYQQHYQDFKDKLQHYITTIVPLEYEADIQQHDTQTAYANFVTLSNWLDAFSPFASQQLALVWQLFQQFPFEIFPLLISLSPTQLKASDIEIFYQLSVKQQLEFSRENISPIQYLSRFYQQFPELLIQIPTRFFHTDSKALKQDLLYSLYHYPLQLSDELQDFILEVYEQTKKHNRQLHHVAIDCLQKCTDITLPKATILDLKALLHDDEIWYLPMSAMRALHAIGIKETWFQHHLLTALDHPYGCDGETPQNTAIDLLIKWQDDGLYAKEKIVEKVQVAIANLDLESLTPFLPYLIAYPQFATEFHRFIWQYLEKNHLNNEDERHTNQELILTFCGLSSRIDWKITEDTWMILLSNLKNELEYADDEHRQLIFKTLNDDLQLEQDKIEALQQWCQQQDQLGLTDDIEIEDEF